MRNFSGRGNSGKLVALAKPGQSVGANSEQVSDSRGWGSGSGLPRNLVGHRSQSRPDRNRAESFRTSRYGAGGPTGAGFQDPDVSVIKNTT